MADHPSLEPAEEVTLGDGRAWLHRPLGAAHGGLALTHGAGGNADSALLLRTAALWSSVGFTVLRFDLPFRVRKAKGPPHPSRSAEDRDGIIAAVELLRTSTAGTIVLGGHSYGGRQASMVAADQASIADGLLLMSYPLHPPKKPEKLRTEHLPNLRVPAVFLHGSRDPFGTTDELRASMQLVDAPTTLVDIDGGGHDVSAAKYRAAERTLDAAAALFGLECIVPADASRA